MSRALVVLAFKADRDRAKRWIDQAPVNARVELKAPKRTLPQNDRMWAMLTDIACQKHHYNLKLTPDEWKLLFMDALRREVRAVPSLDGRGFVNLGSSSSDLSVEEMGDLMEVMAAWGAENGVTFREPRKISGQERGGGNVPARAA